MAHRPHTPGLGGYLLAWLASVLAFTWLLVMFDNAGGSGPLGAPIDEFAAIACWVGVISVLFAPWAMPLVHYTCRNLDAQVLHVFSAGVAGAVVGVLFSLLAPGFVAFVPQLALSTVIGRVVVVPLVWWRRAAAARAADVGPGLSSASVPSSYDDSSGGCRR